MTVSRSSGSADAASIAAAAAARRRAEEARRQAEEARRQAEEARRQAEAARKQREAALQAQREAALQARQAKKALDAQKAKLEKASSPVEQKDTRAEIKRAEKVNADAQRALAAANDKLQAAEEKVARAAKNSENLMREANVAAKSEGKPQPFTEKQIRADGLQVKEVRNAFDGAVGRRREDLARSLGVAPTTDRGAIVRGLEADRQYAKLVSKPENYEALQKLGIRDGETLRAFGERVERLGREGGPDRSSDLPLDAITDKEGLQNVIRGAGQTLEGKGRGLLDDEDFSRKVANGRDIREAVQEHEGLSEVEKAARSGDAGRGLERLGLTQGEFRDLKDADQQAYLDAARSAGQGKYREAVDQLADSGAGAQEAITTAARHLTGPEKDVLTDPASVRALLATNNGQKAVDELAAGRLAEGVRALDGQFPTQVADRIANNPEVKAELEKLGLTPKDLRGSGKAMADLLAATSATEPQARISALADAARANPALTDKLANAVTAVAETMPDGAAKQALSSEELVGALLRGDRQALDALASGDAAGAVKRLSAKPELRAQLIDEAAKSSEFQKGLEESGLTVDQLKRGGRGADELVQAVELLGQPVTGLSADRAVEGVEYRRRQAMELMMKAGGQDPAAQQAAIGGINAVAEQLPGSAGKGVLTDPSAVRALMNGDAQARSALTGFIRGDGAAYAKLEGKPALQAQVLEAAATDPRFAKGLRELGLTTDQISRAKGGDALFAAADKLAQYNRSGALAELREAYAGSPELALEATQELARGLGTEGAQGQLRTLLEDSATAEKLLSDPAYAKSFEAFSRYDIAEGLDALPADPAARQPVLDTLKTNAEFAGGLRAAGLTTGDLAGAKGGLGEMYEGTLAAGKGEFEASMRHFRDAIGAGTSPELATRAATGTAKTQIPGNPPESSALRSMMTDETFVRSLLTDPKLSSTFDALTSRGLLDGLDQVKDNPAAANQVIDALAENPHIKKGLDALGLDKLSLKDNHSALPQLVSATLAASEGRMLEAVGHLGQALAQGNAEAKTINTALDAVSEKLGDTGLEGVVKKLLSADSRDLVLRQGGFLDKIADGDLPGAIGDLLQNPKTLELAGGVLLDDPKIGAFLKSIGVTTPEDFRATFKDAAGGLVTAISHLAEGRIVDGLKALPEAFASIPDAQRAEILGMLADALPIPDKYKPLLAAAGSLITDKAFVGELGEALSVLGESPPNIPGFIGKLSQAFQTAATTEEDAVIQVLNEAGKLLDGPLGTFLADKDFNEALVKSGALSEGLQAVQHLAEGKLGEALGDVASIFGKLVTYGDGFKVGPLTLPVGEDGLKAVGGLLGRIYAVLPEGLKSKVKEKVAEVASRGLIGSIPIFGDAYNIAKDVGPFLDAMKDGDTLDKILNGAQLGLSVAGLVPVLDPLITPFKQGLAVVKTIKEFGESAADAREMADAFV